MSFPLMYKQDTPTVLLQLTRNYHIYVNLYLTKSMKAINNKKD